MIAKNNDVHYEIDRWFNHQQDKFSHVDVFGEVDAEFVKVQTFCTKRSQLSC
jgi:hypothetical protein